MIRERSNRGSLWRFSLASLMFVVACLAGFLSGYRVGHDKGAAAWNSLPMVVRVYPVADLATNARDINELKLPTTDELISSIKTKVVPMTWKDAGGNGEIIPMHEETQLVVSAHSLVHEELAGFLESRRE